MATTRRRTAEPRPSPALPPGSPAPTSGSQKILNWLKRWAIPLIGGVTPVALILINIAVWINDHIGTLRLWVAIAAFISGMMFNSWLGLSIYRWVQRHKPNMALMHESNQEVMLVVGMGVITLVTFLTSLLLYLKLADATALPNALTLWYGIIQIAYPFILKVYVDRDARRKTRTGTVVVAPPPGAAAALSPPPAWSQPPPPPGTLHQAYPPPPPSGPPGRGGYLPPS